MCCSAVQTTPACLLGPALGWPVHPGFSPPHTGTRMAGVEQTLPRRMMTTPRGAGKPLLPHDPVCSALPEVSRAEAAQRLSPGPGCGFQGLVLHSYHCASSRSLQGGLGFHGQPFRSCGTWTQFMAPGFQSTGSVVAA